ncbi:MAG: hypothetical protein ACREDR_12580 [Blastocatellia bacterium]
MCGYAILGAMSILRGVELVEHVIENADKNLTGRGLSKGDLAALTLNGKPLPPSLRRWLEFDSEWAEFTFKPVKLKQPLGPAFEIFEKLLPGDFYQMRAGHGDCTAWFLYAGEADEIGEYPVFLADIDDWYLVKIAYAGFDFFLADKLLAALTRQSHLNFHGYSRCELFGKAADIDGNDSCWEGLAQPPSLENL